MRNQDRLLSKNRPLSKALTALVFLTGTLAVPQICLSQAKYSITVVQEAWVNKKKSSEAFNTLACKNSKIETLAKKKMTWIGALDRKPELILNLDQNSNIWATRNTDDGHLNSVTLWLEIKNQKSYFIMTEVDMENYELPDVKLQNGTLIVQADILVADPKNNDDEFMKGIPVLPSRLYQTLRIGSVDANRIILSSLTCGSK